MAGQTHAQFLQSFEWGEFQKSFGRRVWRIGGFKNDKQVLAAQIVEHYLGLGYAYLYIPRGPIMHDSTSEVISKLSKFIEQKIGHYGTIFLKIEGQNKEIGEKNIKLVRTKSVQPADTILLDLQKTEGDLLSKMHQKTRYNIRLAYKKNLDVKVVTKENFSEEWSLLKATGQRDQISLHPPKYYRLMDEVLGNQDGLVYKKIFIFKDSQPLAMGVFVGFGDTFNYVHGASSNKDREMMAPYLLQWEAIKYAKANGYKYYDFHGVNPVDKKDFEYRP
ncbi:MAG: peptidoglycan bridge formation glycyltransferase FemA/FemB family protein, partial [Candidatus Magasanikbacteria bacterium]|nr:peptidoglycan bridge formation glycyltransferase FemA/FemB family protein [Candidatus Magasanikbacteria bacterium]